MSIDNASDDEMLAIIRLLQEDFTRTGDTWYAERAELLWEQLGARHVRPLPT